jgi:hypothetical protein
MKSSTSDADAARAAVAELLEAAKTLPLRKKARALRLARDLFELAMEAEEGSSKSATKASDPPSELSVRLIQQGLLGTLNQIGWMTDRELDQVNPAALADSLEAFVRALTPEHKLDALLQEAVDSALTKLRSASRNAVGKRFRTEDGIERERDTLGRSRVAIKTSDANPNLGAVYADVHGNRWQRDGFGRPRRLPRD